MTRLEPDRGALERVAVLCARGIVCGAVQYTPYVVHRGPQRRPLVGVQMPCVTQGLVQACQLSLQVVHLRMSIGAFAVASLAGAQRGSRAAKLLPYNAAAAAATDGRSN